MPKPAPTEVLNKVSLGVETDDHKSHSGISPVSHPDSVAQLLGSVPQSEKVAGLIPGQGTCLGCEFRPLSGHVRESMNQCFSFT